MAAQTTWVLGFDGSCATCRKLALDISQLCGNKISVRNLRDPELLQWRGQALEADAEWLPTLFEVNGNEVKAWTKLHLATRLPRAIGLPTTIRLLKLIGEINVAMPDTGRRQFLRTLGATAISVGILSGKQALIPSATMASSASNGAPFQVESTRELTGDERKQYLETIVARREIGQALQATGTALSMSDFQLYGCVVHTLVGNNALTATTWTARDKYGLLHYYFKYPITGVKQVEAVIYQVESNQTVRLVGNSGRLSRPRVQATKPTSAQLFDCDCIYGGNPGHQWYWICDSMNWSCVAVNCAWCAASCFAGIVICVACFGLYCPAQLAACCSASHWECNPC